MAAGGWRFRSCRRLQATSRTMPLQDGVSDEQTVCMQNTHREQRESLLRQLRGP